jgi:phage tail-like protein
MSMSEVWVNRNRFDPDKNFKVRLKWDGRYVAGVSRVSALRRSTQVVEHRDGGGLERKSPGRTTFGPITVERGVTNDTDFEHWANQVSDVGTEPTTGVSHDYRKDVVLEVYNEAGALVIAYTIFHCWPSQYVPLPNLDANANVILNETITLENEGWERNG